jgi:hypothetical protein
MAFMMFWAETTAPRKPRSSYSLVLYGFRLPRRASLDIGAAISACFNQPSMASICRPEMAVRTLDPLMAASPSRASTPGTGIPAAYAKERHRLDISALGQCNRLPGELLELDVNLPALVHLARHNANDVGGLPTCIAFEDLA